jgi:two-component system, chemotaxis family, chemotaxis protein CheY
MRGHFNRAGSKPLKAGTPRLQRGQKKMRHELLVIEDAELHLSILRKIAEQAGFRTTGAHSLAEARQLLRERTFDCITLDLSLGEDSSVEVLRLLSNIKCTAPIIIISASDEETCEATVEIGNFLNSISARQYPSRSTLQRCAGP